MYLHLDAPTRSTDLDTDTSNFRLQIGKYELFIQLDQEIKKMVRTCFHIPEWSGGV
jgi:hypothetical protein